MCGHTYHFVGSDPMTLFFSPSERNQGFDATLDDTVLDLLDLAWMIDKER
jgi:hypothetical protein